MPEVNEGMDQTSSGNAAGGFWIRRPAYPTGLRRSRVSHLQDFVTPTDNKENILPTSVRRSVRQRKSPLPYWYPRTPLRDITVVVNGTKSREHIESIEKALERRRLGARAANIQQGNSNLEELSIGSSIVDDELNASEYVPTSQVLPSGGSNTSQSPADTPLSQVLSSEVSDTSTSVVNTPISQVLHSDVSDTLPSHADGGYSSSTHIGLAVTTTSSSNAAAAEHPSCSESVSSKISTANPKTVEYEKKLQKIVDELELVVKENSKRAPSQPAQKSTRILMSMR